MTQRNASRKVEIDRAEESEVGDLTDIYGVVEITQRRSDGVFNV